VWPPLAAVAERTIGAGVKALTEAEAEPAALPVQAGTSCTGHERILGPLQGRPSGLEVSVKPSPAQTAN
jgi:hypothetical protein